MKTPFLFTAFLFILIITSCDECALFPCLSKYELGDTLWIHELPGKDSLFIYHSLALGKNKLYYAAGGGTAYWTPLRVVALNTDDGSILWTSGRLDAIGGPESDHELVVGDDGTVYITGTYKLYAIDPLSGAFKWVWEVPETLPHDGGTIFTKGAIGNLALTSEGNLILGSTGGGVYHRALYGVSKGGVTKFANIDAVAGSCTPISIDKNNTAYYYTSIAAGKPCLVAADASSGQIKWYREILSYQYALLNIAIQDDGNLFCAFKKKDSDIFSDHIVNAGDGNILWSGNEKAYIWRMIAPDGRRYERDGLKVYYLDQNNNKMETIVNSATIGAITDNNRLVCAYAENWQSKLGAFYSDGQNEYHVDMTGIMGNDLVISDDKVIFGIINLHPASLLPTKICAVQGNSKLAKKGWPRPKHDNRNTGNAAKY